MFNSENKETVTIIFAVDANHDLYKVARFTEKIYNKQRYCWSHLGNLVYCAEQSGDDAPVKRDENYFDPITRYELMYYFRNPNESEFYRVSEMLKRSGFDKKAVAFYMLIITVDCDTNKEQHHMYFITKCDLGVEYMFLENPLKKFLLVEIIQNFMRMAKLIIIIKRYTQDASTNSLVHGAMNII